MSQFDIADLETLVGITRHEIFDLFLTAFLQEQRAITQLVVLQSEKIRLALRSSPCSIEQWAELQQDVKITLQHVQRAQLILQHNLAETSVFILPNPSDTRSVRSNIDTLNELLDELRGEELAITRLILAEEDSLQAFPAVGTFRQLQRRSRFTTSDDLLSARWRR